jgi:hypothetical protein
MDYDIPLYPIDLCHYCQLQIKENQSAGISEQTLCTKPSYSFYFFVTLENEQGGQRQGEGM